MDISSSDSEMQIQKERKREMNVDEAEYDKKKKAGGIYKWSRKTFSWSHWSMLQLLTLLLLKN
jgi:hypothetical protein